MVDSHCHLAGTQFVHDLDAVVGRALAAGVERAFVILAADDEAELTQAREVEAHWPDVRFAIGVHPHAAGKFSVDPAGAVTTTDAAIVARPLTRAVGEIGLDYHYEFSPRDVQQEVFRGQIRLARRAQLPIVIHTREAEDDTFRLLEEESAGDVGGVFHCFTGSPQMARRALDAGFHISLAGIVTFPRALELHDVARTVPLDRLLVETDSPFLAPVPHRGTRNEPGRVVRVIEAIADLRGLAAPVVAEATGENFRQVFRP
jgi:TatD DNase family protein